MSNRITLIQRGNPGKSGGFSLIEVLVALIILAIGLLGLAGLQLEALRKNNSAYLRSQATILAYDIKDRMRANRGPALQGHYNIALTASPPSNPATQAGRDLAAWTNALASTLPGPGDGSVAMNGSRVTVIVQWHDIREGTTQFQTQSEL